MTGWVKAVTPKSKDLTPRLLVLQPLKAVAIYRTQGFLSFNCTTSYGVVYIALLGISTNAVWCEMGLTEDATMVSKFRC